MMGTPYNESQLGIFCSIYNGEEFLEGYFENMVEQTIFQDVNFYFLDNASTDGTWDKIQKFLEQDFIQHKGNVFACRLDKDKGLYAGWNECVSWTKEPYIGNWNVDDRKNPWSLEVLLKELERDISIDLVYGKTLVTNKPNDEWQISEAKTVFPIEPPSLESLLRNNSPHCMPIWKRSLHDRFGKFNEEYLTASDTDMWLRAIKGGAKFKMINDVVGLYFENPKGRSTNPETLQKMIKEVNLVRDKYR